LPQIEIHLIPIGTVERDILNEICKGLERAYTQANCTITNETMEIPKQAYNKLRNQYNSTIIIEEMRRRFVGEAKFLGITQVDLYVPKLNFVFGEAECPGRIALISLYRLYPEFYGEPPNRELFLERAVKEAVHEVGHTLGLKHCRNPLCVMHFSNSIWDTDTKWPVLCPICTIKLQILLRKAK